MTIPTQLSKYVVSEVVGRGAMGTVYRAHDPVLQRDVAIKTVHRHLLQDDGGTDMLVRLRNEAAAAARLSHPSIVPVHDFCEADDGPFIVMEYLEGGTLSKPLRQRIRLSNDAVVALMVQLLEGLAYAHERGICHRDVKPSNLLLTAEGKLKIADFGIARVIGAQTQLGTRHGTPGYMAPEQYSGRSVDARADVFAAGAVMYALLTQRAPFVGSDDQVMFQTLNVEPLPPSRVHGSARPTWFDEVIARAMSKQPGNRFEDAAAFRQAVLAGAQTTGATAQAPLAGAADDELPGAPALAAHAQGSTTSPPTASLTWPSDTVAQLERALAALIGPIARVVMKRAVATAPDADSLRAHLAQQIPDAARREAFLRQTRHTGTGSRTATSASGSTALDPALLEAARSALALHLGMIASPLVNRAATQAHSSSHFIALLAAHLADSRQREAFVRTVDRSRASR